MHSNFSRNGSSLNQKNLQKSLHQKSTHFQHTRTCRHILVILTVYIWLVFPQVSCLYSIDSKFSKASTRPLNI